jgi:hypothetical protein
MKDTTPLTILRNKIPSDVLHVICVISNPCNYESRYRLAREFLKRMRIYKQIKLLLVELVYHNQPFSLEHENVLRLRTDTNPMWVKENLINIGIRHLPSDWKYVAWIDADIEFDNPHWVTDTLRILNGSKDIVQLWQMCNFLDQHNKPSEIDHSMGYLYCKNITGKYRHPGYAWACTRKAYETLGYVHDESILGSGDTVLAFALMGKNHIDSKYDPTFSMLVDAYVEKAKKLRFGYTPGVINHFFHGTRKSRGYTTRYKLLIEHKFAPMIHLAYDYNGLICQSIYFPEKLAKEITEYFKSRQEDESK